MDVGTLKAKIFGLILALAMAQPVWAGKLDLEYGQTSPTKALVAGLAFPGLGHYYLSKRDPKLKKQALLFMVLGLGSGALVGMQFKHGDDTKKIASLLLAGGIKIWEFSSSTRIAEAERLKWFKKYFKTTGAEEAAEPAPQK